MPKEQSWDKQFIEEFGIHFKGSKGELQFAIEFIREEKTKSYREGVKDMIKTLEEVEDTIGTKEDEYWADKTKRSDEQELENSQRI